MRLEEIYDKYMNGKWWTYIEIKEVPTVVGYVIFFFDRKCLSKYRHANELR